MIFHREPTKSSPWGSSAWLGQRAFFFGTSLPADSLYASSWVFLWTSYAFVTVVVFQCGFGDGSCVPTGQFAWRQPRGKKKTSGSALGSKGKPTLTDTSVGVFSSPASVKNRQPPTTTNTHTHKSHLTHELWWCSQFPSHASLAKAPDGWFYIRNSPTSQLLRHRALAYDPPWSSKTHPRSLAKPWFQPFWSEVWGSAPPLSTSIFWSWIFQ